MRIHRTCMMSGGLVAALLLLGWTATAVGVSNSLFLRGYAESADELRMGPATAGPSKQNEPLYILQQAGEHTARAKPVLQASWITVEEPSPKDYRVHDLVTIIVHEVSKHASKSDAKTEREYTLNAALKEWFRLTKDNIRPAGNHGDITFDLAFNREMEGKGDIKREDTLTARIQSEVVDVLPNGNLVLEATRTIVTDEESTTITLAGVCRTKDIAPDNTLLSTQLARLELQKNHTGQVRDAVKRGLLSGILDFLNPF